MPTYPFNTQHHVRIWFSANPNVFLNDENQLRMVRFRQKNPRAEMTLLYSASMLNDEALEQLNLFCLKHGFKPLDFDTELLANCKETIDHDMYSIAKLELDAFTNKQGGNLAAASDAARLINPLIVRGTYSDFDTNIEVESLSDTIEINGPVLVDGGSVNLGLRDAPLINNDIIGASTLDGELHPAAKDKLRLIQNDVIACYRQGAMAALARASSTVITAASPLVMFYKMQVFKSLFDYKPLISIPDFRLFLDKSTRNIFNSLRLIPPKSGGLTDITSKLSPALHNKLTSALSNFEQDDFPDDFSEEEKQSIKTTYINVVKAGIEGMRSYFFRLINPQQALIADAAYQIFSEVADPDECYRLINLPITGTRNLLLKESVTLFGGPSRLMALFDYSDIKTLEEISFDGNKLFNHFNSSQSFHFGTSIEVIQSKAQTQVGEVCDMSWLSIGQELVKEREGHLHKAARTIQASWKNHLSCAKPPLPSEETPTTTTKKN